jgi:hypothetical protein
MDDHIFGPTAQSRTRIATAIVTWNKSEAKRLLERDLEFLPESF